MKRWIGVVLVLVCFAGCAEDQRTAAMQRIVYTKVFAFGGIGFAGVTSDGEKDFQSILALPSAAKDFETIYATGTPEAKSYALAGIRQLNKARFKRLLSDLGDSQQKVHTMQGCILDERSLIEIARAIDSGRYDPWLKPESTH